MFITLFVGHKVKKNYLVNQEFKNIFQKKIKNVLQNKKSQLSLQPV
jgi:hypothetical protein